eukprot:Skav231292  [mRNA]  locus=scaffold161:216711:218882:+ [translate_table: standard]
MIHASTLGSSPKWNGRKSFELDGSRLSVGGVAYPTLCPAETDNRRDDLFEFATLCRLGWTMEDYLPTTGFQRQLFLEALLQSLLDQDVKWFMTALLRTCRAHTNELSQPCGKCDKYKDVSMECSGSTS